jgi:hypothetical protein
MLDYRIMYFWKPMNERFGHNDVCGIDLLLCTLQAESKSICEPYNIARISTQTARERCGAFQQLSLEWLEIAFDPAKQAVNLSRHVSLQLPRESGRDWVCNLHDFLYAIN